MNKILLSSLLLFSTLTIAAGTASGGDSDFEQSSEATHIPAMILVTEGEVDEVIADLESQGIEILRHRGNILLAFVPRTHREAPRRIKGVRDIEFSRPRLNTPTMAIARNFNRANLIAEGYGLPQAYDGSNVVIGVCDIGIDTRHPNFLNSAGECRIRRAVHYREQQGERIVYDTPEDIYEWRTDNADEWHATHVAGIAAGSDRRSNYYSLAPEADIVFTGSQLSDVGLLAGVEDIIDYAKEVGKPAVINLSMGNYVGPKDGTSLFCRYLDMCSDDAIICLSAGNEGNLNWMPRSMSYDFPSSTAEFRARISDWASFDIGGETEIWSKDSTPFTFKFYVNNDTDFKLRQEIFDAIDFPADGSYSWRVSVDPQDPDYNAELAKFFYEGYVQATGGISILNGRFFVNLQFELKTNIPHIGGDGLPTTHAEYWPAILITAEKGAHIDAYTQGGLRFHQEKGGFQKVDNSMCISDLATGHKTISVGMINTTQVDEGALPGSGYALGDVHLASSYGTLHDGRVLPLTCAPGALITSSISGAYLEKHQEEIANTADAIEFDGKTAYYMSTLGTSMSCPYVVSTIATWLQAYPQLTSDQAIEIIGNTNQTDGYNDPSNPRHGQGWINPYNGLQSVLSLSSLTVGSPSAPEIALRYHNDIVYVGNPSGEAVTIEVYNLAGISHRRTTISDGSGSISLSALSPGAYIIRATDCSGKSKIMKIIL